MSWMSFSLQTLTLTTTFLRKTCLTHMLPLRFDQFARSTQELSFLHINCRSLSHKVHDIIILNNFMKANIITVTETWLNSDTSVSIVIPRYSFTSACRCGGKEGGVGFFIHYTIEFSLFTLLLDVTTFEYLFVKLRIHHYAIIVGVIYQPSTNLQKFNEELRLLLDRTVRCQSFVLLGEFHFGSCRQLKISWYFCGSTSHLQTPIFNI